MFLGVAGALELSYLKLAASGPEISMNPVEGAVV